MIKKTLCIRDYQDFTVTGETYGYIKGFTSVGDVEYYTGQEESSAYIAIIPILISGKIDDIGFYNPASEEWLVKTTYNSGNTISYEDKTYVCVITHVSGYDFDDLNWEMTPNESTRISIVDYVGDSKINEFRRYGKQGVESDLYNPTWNTGFTQEINSSNGLTRQITGEREKEDGSSKQNLYDYKIWDSNNTGSTINYSDIDSEFSEISYNTRGLTTVNSINSPSVKLDYLIGVVNEPKINIDVFIDRGSNSSFDRHMKLGDIKSLTDLETYGNGYFKIKEN